MTSEERKAEFQYRCIERAGIMVEGNRELTEAEREAIRAEVRKDMERINAV